MFVRVECFSFCLLIMHFNYSIAHRYRYGVGRTTLNFTVLCECFYYLVYVVCFHQSKS
jgi:hypothetical protein